MTGLPEITAVSRLTIRPGDRARWLACPNDPPCAHSGLLHDIDSLDDPKPMCCADGCNCGKTLAGMTLEVVQGG